jgi:hypothetical protein
MEAHTHGEIVLCARAGSGWQSGGSAMGLELEKGKQAGAQGLA